MDWIQWIQIAGIVIGWLASTVGMTWYLSRHITHQESDMASIKRDLEELVRRERERDGRLARHVEDKDLHMDARSWKHLTDRLDRIEHGQGETQKMLLKLIEKHHDR